VLASAASIVLVHNHPSGDPEPSEEDLSITKRLTEAGDLLGIGVLDHVIVASRGVPLCQHA
jgi:DNA repair protein RadC